jgi:hypothetical protein
MSTIDILIPPPLIPLAPLLVAWYLPWENWLWVRLPKGLRLSVGPDAPYASFVLWRFKGAWWSGAVGNGMGLARSAWSVRQILKTRVQESTGPNQPPCPTPPSATPPAGAGGALRRRGSLGRQA